MSKYPDVKMLINRGVSARMFKIPIDEYLAIASVVLDVDAVSILRTTDLGLAESALHAPFAGFGNQEFYLSDIAKAGVLLVRLIKNHPLVDGNKRTAFLTTVRFLELGGYSWSVDPIGAFEKLLAIAAGEMDDDGVVRWISATSARIP